MARFEEGARHVGYELCRMVDAAVRLPPTRTGPMDDLMLEAVLLHSRNLFDFLTATGSGPEGTALWHGDFTDRWSARASELEAKHASVIAEVNKRLAHLTWERSADPDRSAYTLLVDDLYRHYKDFAEVVSNDPHSDEAAARRFRADVATARMKLRAGARS